MRLNGWLLAGGGLSALAAAAHVGCIFGGPAWFRFFGAGEGMARASARGEPRVIYITLFIAGVLALWSVVAFSGAGLLPRLPLLRTGLVAITAIYLLRGLLFVPIIAARHIPIDAFAIWSSLIVLAYGVVYAVGTWSAWPALSGKP
ncbi:MAG: hypothetical protein JWP35_4024 [Caulobacter sp.]|nr:hypothetical protein [Caulobacter sp.]